MGYYDKERVRGFLHNQDGIIVNDFGEEVILRGWGMGNWDNPEGFMLGTQSGFVSDGGGYCTSLQTRLQFRASADPRRKLSV